MNRALPVKSLQVSLLNVNRTLNCKYVWLLNVNKALPVNKF